MAARIRVEERACHTAYFFRGPRSHRPVEVYVQHDWHMRWREETALKEANARFLREWFGRAVEFAKNCGTATGGEYTNFEGGSNGLREKVKTNRSNTRSNSNPPTGDDT